jgi:hypothetical protein
METLTVEAGARGRRIVPILAAALMAAAALLVATHAQAQSADAEMSCAPETVRAGGAATCTLAGMTASTRVNVDVVRDGAVIGQSSAVAGTDGRATVIVEVPGDTTSGPLTLTLRGTTLTFGVTVIPGAPTGVAAGYSPSLGDVDRALPPPVIMLLSTLLLALALGRVRPSAGRAG